MEITSKFKERENPSPLNSPNTHRNGNGNGNGNGNSPTTTSCSSSNNNNNNNNSGNHNKNNPSPLPITRSDPNSPYPTTFVTADTTSFKQVVQMLTGSSEIISKNPKQQQNQQHEITTSTTTTSSSKSYVIPPIKTAPKKQGFKLYERRNSIKNLISPLTSASSLAVVNFCHQNSSFSPRHKPEILSPSLLDFPSLTLSPVTPLLEDPFDKSSSSPSIAGAGAGAGVGGGGNGGDNVGANVSSEEQEQKAIAEKGYYLHPSPISTPRGPDSQPQLLPLFPLSSPRISDP